jgi:hypothetical protein
MYLLLSGSYPVLADVAEPCVGCEAAWDQNRQNNFFLLYERILLPFSSFHVYMEK